jgi:hypothetical protein
MNLHVGECPTCSEREQDLDQCTVSCFVHLQSVFRYAVLISISLRRRPGKINKANCTAIAQETPEKVYQKDTMAILNVILTNGGPSNKFFVPYSMSGRSRASLASG